MLHMVLRYSLLGVFSDIDLTGLGVRRDKTLKTLSLRNRKDYLNCFFARHVRRPSSKFTVASCTIVTVK
ncbi:hypothetical protein M3J09_009944 [Ascochyta lentis]